MSNTWHRPAIRRINFEQRMEVERRLAKGETGKSIAKSMGIAPETIISACKKNPWPGGVLDRKGALAKFQGEFLDETGYQVPWMGLDKDGKPIRKAKDKPAEAVPTKSAIARPAVNPSDDPARGKRPEGKPETGKASPPPNADHEGSKVAEDLGDPVTGSEKQELGVFKGKLKSGNRNLKAARRFSRKALPLEERIEILAALARDPNEPQVALRAITILNELDGLLAAAKEPAASAMGSGPLFTLPRGMSMSMSPVGQQEQLADEPSADQSEQGPEDRPQEPEPEPESGDH